MKKTTTKDLIRPLLIIAAIIFSSFFSQAQTANSKRRTISGSVYNEQNSPLKGVSVAIFGQTSDVYTDSLGRYQVSVNSAKDQISFKFSGYHEKEVVVGNRNIINITMTATRSDELYLSMGIGKQKIAGLSGAVALYRPEHNEYEQNIGIDQMMQGRLAGVLVNQNSQDPAAASTIDIRGINSIKGNTDPLYVIDGIPVTLTSYSAIRDRYNAITNTNPLALMNPNDVASITVLKDAYSTAVYGSRGSNGVILINTKFGKSSLPSLRLNLSTGVSALSHKVSMMNSSDYALYANEYAQKNNTAIPFSAAQLNNLPFYDHQKDITRLGKTYDLNGIVSGSVGSSSFYVSGQYFRNEGVAINSDLQRINFRANYRTDISKKFHVINNLNISHTKLLGTDNNSAILSALTWAPTSPLLNANGSYNVVNDYQYNNPLFTPSLNPSNYDPNPLAIVHDYKTEENQYQVFGNFGIKYDIVKNLNAYAKVGLNYNIVRDQTFRPTYLPVNNITGRATTGNITNIDITGEGGLNFDRDFKQHHLDATLAVLSTQNSYKYYELGVSNFIENITGYYSLDAGSIPDVPFAGFVKRRTLGLTGRFNYDYASKIFIGVSGNYDGVSVASVNNKYAFYPAVSAAWLLSKEAFMSGTGKVLSEVKLRASYGLSGNSAGLIPYLSLQQLAPGTQTQNTNLNEAFGSSLLYGIAPFKIVNDHLKPERSSSANVGIDLSNAQNTFRLSVDVYQRETTNLLLSAPNLPLTTGYSQALLRNAGSLRNRGLELDFNAKILDGKFKWRADFNIAFNQSMLLNLGENPAANQNLGSAGVSSAPYQVLAAGQPIGSFWGYVGDGIWNSQNLASKSAAFMPGARAGDRKYLDLNSDGVLDARDRTFIGNAQPKYFGGLTNAFSFKNFSLHLWLSYEHGNQVFNQTRWLTESANSSRNQAVSVNDRWTPANTNASIVGVASQTNASEIWDGLLENGAFVKVKNATLSYAVNKSFCNRLKVSALNFFVSGSNLWTITGYKGIDPQNSSQDGIIRGVDTGLYPASRSFKLGINVSF